MKKVMVGFCILSILFSCNIRNTKYKLGTNMPGNFNDTTSVQMIDSIYDFGRVPEGEKVVYNYHFRNTGKNSLIIASATASCGCTVPEKPEEPIKPGETGVLKVVFNSQGRAGKVNKEINVVSNAYPQFPVLQLTGEVISTDN
ncbi:MAG: DUF1573 domain-containing protein [Bacteroidota bacterium]|nr:DUF1573 domain-containing protein [Bacteroidota bacterium]